MTEQINPIILTAKCPRCGYDLRGAIDTWREQCPLLGICTECGLEVKWAEVLHPEKFEPQWCVEFAPSGKLLLLSCGKTFLRSFWPFRFWSMLKMSLDIRWGRIALYLAALLLPVFLSYVCVQSAMAFRVRSYMQQRVTDWQNDIQTQRADFNANKQSFIQHFKELYKARKNAIALLEDKIQSDEETQDETQPTELWIKEIEEQEMEDWVKQKLQVGQQYYPKAIIAVSIDHSYMAAIAEAVFLPWKGTSFAKLGSAWGSQQYPAPVELRQYIKDKSLVVSNFDRNDFLTTLSIVILGFWTCLLFPFTFIFLPISRRRAKVRWGHVLRVTCYSAFIPSSVICTTLFAASMSYIFLAASTSWFVVAHFACRYLMMPMLIIWWAAAIKRYMCIAHGWMTAILLTAILAMAYFLLAAQLFNNLPISLFIN